MASARHFWGAELRAQRDARGLSLNDLGKLVHRDASYLAKIEKGDRNIPADVASDCDRALNAGGMLVRLHALVARGDGQQVIPAPPDARHAANQGTQVANEASWGVSSESLGASQAGEDEQISVPARTADGRIIFVRVSRRLFLGAVGASAVGTAPPPTAQLIASVPRVSSSWREKVNWRPTWATLPTRSTQRRPREPPRARTPGLQRSRRRSPVMGTPCAGMLVYRRVLMMRHASC